MSASAGDRPAVLEPPTMRPVPRRCSRWLAAAVAAAALASSTAPVAAQIPPLLGPAPTSTTTTTPAPRSPAPAPSTEDPAAAPSMEGAAPAPPGAVDAQGDGAPAPSGGIRVPPEAQRIIDSVPRTGPNSSRPLLDALAPVAEMGVPWEEVLRIGMGRFPIAGEARYGHDWLYPRYGPGFRFHLGTDVFADHGTPVRSPVDGIARSANGGLGGLTVKVFMDDGTYFYLAHLSGLVDGFTDGMAVRTGDVVGYVGDSGNARGGAPHLHIGIYPKGGPPVDPKPILDGFLQEAMDRVPAVIEAVRQAQAGAQAAAPVPEPASGAPVAAADDEPEHPTLLRPLLHRALLRLAAEAAEALSASLV